MYAHGYYYTNSGAYIRYRCLVCRKTQRIRLIPSSDEERKAILKGLAEIRKTVQALMEILE
jgi:hypothetical protein